MSKTLRVVLQFSKSDNPLPLAREMAKVGFVHTGQTSLCCSSEDPGVLTSSGFVFNASRKLVHQMVNLAESAKLVKPDQFVMLLTFGDEATTVTLVE